MALVSLEEAKNYLRVDTSDDDALVGVLLSSAGQLCADVARLTDKQWEFLNSDEDAEVETEPGPEDEPDPDSDPDPDDGDGDGDDDVEKLNFKCPSGSDPDDGDDDGEGDDSNLFTEAELARRKSLLRVAILYSLGYLYEHREEADHHALTISLRNLLFPIREGVW